MSSNGDGLEAGHAGRAMFTCPHCNQAVEAEPGETAQTIACPVCGQTFVLPSADGSLDLPEENDRDAAALEHAHAAREQELDGLRVRNLVVAKRAAIRSRTYAIVGAVLCLMTAIDMVISTVTDVRKGGWHPKEVGYVMVAAAALLALIPLVQNAILYGRESKAVVIPEPETPPDFSTLSDGSQISEQLKDVK
jgi:hypothetical protein